MKTYFPLLLLSAALALLLPSSQMQSQLVPPSSPAVTAGNLLETLQTMQKTNVDLLKRQDDLLKDLTEQTNTARESRIFSKRG